MFLVLFIFILLLFVLNFSDIMSKVEIFLSEKVYLSTSSYDDLFDMCTELTTIYDEDKVLKYFPQLFEDIEQLKNEIKKAEQWEDRDNNKITDDDVLNIYIFTYLSSVYDLKGEEEFKKEFIKYKEQLTIVENENSIIAFDYLKLYFFEKYPDVSSKVSKDKTKAFIDVFYECWNADERSEYVSNYFYEFCYYWYSMYIDYDKASQFEDAASKPFSSSFAWREELPNNYAIGYNRYLSDNYSGVAIGKKGFSEDSIIFDISSDVVSVSYNDLFICAEQNKNEQVKYYIINTKTNDIQEFADEVKYSQAIIDNDIVGLKKFTTDEEGMKDVTE